MVDGIKMMLGGEEYIVPPLNLKQVRKYEQQLLSIGNIDSGNPFANIGVIIEIITAALSRNYPDITDEKMGELLDLSNMKRVIEAVIGQSGLVSRGEA